MSRIPLDKIPALTLYKDALTSVRRSTPIPQLSCIGKACQLYTPDVVRCTNIGGHGTDVDWKCEADLPESLRFGRVHVSCEGWSQAGDPYVLKGSCGLEYRLVEVPREILGDHDHPTLLSRWFQPDTILSSIFAILWVALLVYFLYTILRSCLSSRRQSAPAPSPPPRRPPSNSRSWFPGTHFDDFQAPPPPYSKHPQSESRGGQPGFWTGAALGGLGTYLLSRNSRQASPPPPREVPPVRRFWDWERTSAGRAEAPFASARRPSRFDTADRGEGSSNLGSMRSSTGFGGSSSR